MPKNGCNFYLSQQKGRGEEIRNFCQGALSSNPKELNDILMIYKISIKKNKNSGLQPILAFSPPCYLMINSLLMRSVFQCLNIKKQCVHNITKCLKLIHTRRIISLLKQGQMTIKEFPVFILALFCFVCLFILKFFLFSNGMKVHICRWGRLLLKGQYGREWRVWAFWTHNPWASVPEVFYCSITHKTELQEAWTVMRKSWLK